MRKTVLAALASATFAAVPAPAASATHSYTGTCGMYTFHDGQLMNPDQFSGLVYTSTTVTNPPSAPATVTCNVKVNGAVVTSDTFGGTGTVVDFALITFVAPPGSFVELCTTVTAAAHATTSCVPATWTGNVIYV